MINIYNLILKNYYLNLNKINIGYPEKNLKRFVQLYFIYIRILIDVVSFIFFSNIGLNLVYTQRILIYQCVAQL